MSFPLQPLEDRVIVQPAPAESTTAAGLLIPDVAQELPVYGTVLAAGPGRFENGSRLPMDVSVGDVVLYGRYGGTAVSYEGESYLIFTTRELLAVVG